MTDSIVRGYSLWSQRLANDGVVGSAVGAEYGGALPLILRMALATAAVVAAVAGAANGKRSAENVMRNIIFAWALGAATSALYGVITFTVFGGDSPLADMPFLYHVISESRAIGLANHPNSFGQSVAVSLPILLYMTSVMRGPKRMLAIGSVPVAIFATILSGSRGVMVLTAVILALSVVRFMYYARRSRRSMLLVLALLVPIGLYAYPTVLASTRFGTEAGEISNAARFASLTYGFKLFESNPLFGTGVGSWIAEMVPLIVLTSGGLVYFAVFYGSLLKALSASRQVHNLPLRSALMLSALGVLAFGLVNNAIVERYLYWPFAVLFVLSLAVQRTSGLKLNGTSPTQG